MASNRLSEETSPYLQQHKDNPVHWWPWCQEAFQEAQRLDKPVLLSIGYAACHWCHVMAHESFEKEDTAALMNDLFVNVKVDREERPDVDTLYMTALQELGEQGGWPLTMFLLPDGMPFFGGTYFPDEPRYGRPSFKQVLENVARVYATEKETIKQNTAYLKIQADAPAQLRRVARILRGAVRRSRQQIHRRHRSDQRRPSRGAQIPEHDDLPFSLEGRASLWAHHLHRGGEEHAPAYLPGRHLRPYRRRLFALLGR